MKRYDDDVNEQLRNRLDAELADMKVSTELENRIVAAMGETRRAESPDHAGESPGYAKGRSQWERMLQSIGRFLDAEIVFTMPQMALFAGVIVLGAGLYAVQFQQLLTPDEAELALYRELLRSLREYIHIGSS